MAAFKKIIRWSLWILMVLLALVTALHLLLPHVVNSNIVRDKIESQVESAINGQFGCTAIKLGILPRPQGAIIDASLSIPGKIHISAVSASVSLKILPLLTGKIQIAALTVQSPVVKLQLSTAATSDTDREQQLTLAALRETAGPILGAIAGPIEGGRLLVSNGHLTLRRGADRIQFEALELALAESDGLLRLEVKARSNGIKQLNAKALIKPQSLDATGQIESFGVRPGQIFTAWFPDKNIDIPDADLDVGLTFETQGLETWQAVLTGRIPEIPLSKDGQQIINQVELDCTLTAAPDLVHIALSRLAIESPRVKLTGALRWQPEIEDKTATLQVEMQAQAIDLTAVRRAAIALMGHTPDYLEMVRGGVLKDLNALSQAADWSGLIDVDNLTISGMVTEGSIRIPGPDWDLADVAGNIAFRRGTLEADQASARMGATTAANGRLSMDLMAKPVPLDLAVDLDADLIQIPDLMKQFISDKQILSQMEPMTITRGRAAGTLSLAGNLDDIVITVEARDISLTLKDKRLPSALTLTGEQLSYSAEGIGFKNIGARFKGSSLNRVSGQLRWEPEMILELRDAGADLVCREIYPLLISNLGQRLPTMAPKTLGGRIIVTHAAIKGPLTSPHQWQFRAKGNLKELTAETELIPDPLTIKGGKFGIDSQQIDVSDLAIFWQDAALDISARMTGYLTPNPSIELKGLKGEIGDRAAATIHQRLNLSPEWRTHTPVSIKTARGRWHGTEGVQLQADLMWPGDLNISLTLSAGNREFKLDHLRISDEQSDALMALRRSSVTGQWDMRYKGHLDQTSLAKLWFRQDIMIGGVDGDFAASIMIDAPRQSVVRGQLDARRIILPLPGLDPITIGAARISARDRILDIHNLDLAWLQQQVQLSGEIDFSGDIFRLDLGLLSDDLDLTRIEAALVKDTEAEKPAPTGVPQKPTPKFQGLVKLDVARLRYDHYTFEPLKGDLVIQEDRIRFDVAEARLCGLSTEGRIELAQKELSLALRPLATGQTIEYIGGCLTATTSTERYEGVFNMEGQLSTIGQDRGELIRNLSGNLQIKITDGRIQNAGNVGVFTNLLGYLRINNIVSGNTTDLRSSDFVYKTLFLKIDASQGRITLSEAYLNADSLNLVAEGNIDLFAKILDLNVLVSPLTTVDSLVRHIPLVGNILQGTLVAVPVKVRGDIADPIIVPLSPGAIGSRVAGILKRTLQAPFQIIDIGDTGNNAIKDQMESPSEMEDNAP